MRQRRWTGAGRLAGAWLVGLGLLRPAAAAEDLLAETIEQALAEDRPAAALLLLEDEPRREAANRWRLLWARACRAAGRFDEAAAALGYDAGKLTVAWPAPLAGAAHQEAGELAIQVGDLAAASRLVGRALELGGRTVVVDRCLLLVAQSLLSDAPSEADQALALRYARRLWSNWGRSPYRWEAGLLLAEWGAEAHPELASRIVDDLRHRDGVPAAIAEAAWSLACRRAWPDADRVERLASRGLDRFPGARELQIWDFRAAAIRDPMAAKARLDQGPAWLATEPRLASARQRLVAATAAADPVDATWQQARRTLAAGERSTALELLRSQADRHPASARLLAQEIDDPVAAVDAPWLRDGQARVLLADRLFRQGEMAALRRVLLDWQAPSETPVPAWVQRGWYLQAHSGIAADRAWNNLRKVDLAGVEAGEAWARHAQELGQEGAEGALDAWRRAARALPPDHPWALRAATEVARRSLDPLPPGARVDPLPATRAATLDAALTIVGGLAWRADDDENLALRYLLLQLQAQRGLAAEAQRTLEELHRHADESRHERLRIVAQRLAGWAGD